MKVRMLKTNSVNQVLVETDFSVAELKAVASTRPDLVTVLDENKKVVFKVDVADPRYSSLSAKGIVFSNVNEEDKIKEAFIAPQGTELATTFTLATVKKHLATVEKQITGFIAEMAEVEIEEVQ